MPEDNKYKKIPRKIRKEIANRAKVEAGLKGSPEGRKLRTGLTGGKKKYNLKGIKGGAKQGAEDRPKPDKPKFKKVQVQAKKFGPKGQVSKSKTYSVTTKEGMEKATTTVQKEAGSDIIKKSKSDVGKKEFAENEAKKAKYKKDLKHSRREKGERTRTQKEKLKGLADERLAHIRDAGGKVRKGKRRFKKVLKKRMKKDYLENNYKKY